MTTQTPRYIDWERIIVSKEDLQRDARVKYQSVVETWTQSESCELERRAEKGTLIEITYRANQKVLVLLDPVQGVRISRDGIRFRVI